MVLLKNTPHDIACAGEALRTGKLVAIPTETVYGLAGNIWIESAIAGIFKAKERPSFDPLIVHIANPDDVASIAAIDSNEASNMHFGTKGDAGQPDVTTSTAVNLSTLKDSPRLPSKNIHYLEQLIDAFWPGPLTLILPRRPSISNLVTSGLDTVAIRCPALPLTRDIILSAGVPVAAPSANLFGRLSPTTAQHVAEQLGDRIDFIIDGGQTSIGVESTILDLASETPTILRPGALPLEALQKIIPKLKIHERKAFELPTAPGQLLSHYAPQKPLIYVSADGLTNRAEISSILKAIDATLQKAPATLCQTDEYANSGHRTVSSYKIALTFGANRTQEVQDTGLFEEVIDLSPEGSDLQAAVKLFSLLHELEAGPCTSIWAEPLPTIGLGLAINDRLYKASVKLTS